MGSGATALTRTLRATNSADNVRASERSAALLAALESRSFHSQTATRAFRDSGDLVEGLVDLSLIISGAFLG